MAVGLKRSRIVFLPGANKPKCKNDAAPQCCGLIRTQWNPNFITGSQSRSFDWILIQLPTPFRMLKGIVS
jgi:hypothetical protein